MKKRKGGFFIVALVAVAFLMKTTAASAAVTEVICVPWQGNVLADHVTWDGKNILLKAVVHADTTDSMSYTWNFGDATADVTGTLSGSTKYNVDVFHTYSGSLETPFIATLTVNDGTNEISDTYRVRIKTFDLDAERAVAVDDALWWLYRQQYADGHWYSYSSYYSSPTASAVHAFEVNNHLETGDPNEDPYVETVAKGLEYIFTTRLQANNIGLQTYGNPDTNGNGIGIEVVGSREIYEGGMVMDAIINSRTPGADSGRDFDSDGTKISNAKFIRVLHNGILIQENVERKAMTRAGMKIPEAAENPIMLQGNHGPIAYRNIYVRPLPD